jgi:hypothetical protein
MTLASEADQRMYGAWFVRAYLNKGRSMILLNVNPAITTTQSFSYTRYTATNLPPFQMSRGRFPSKFTSDLETLEEKFLRSKPMEKVLEEAAKRYSAKGYLTPFEGGRFRLILILALMNANGAKGEFDRT